MKIAGLRLATAGAAAAALVTMTACSSGLGGASASSSAAGGSGSGNGGGTLTLLTDNADVIVKAAQSVVSAFEKANPGVTIKTETRPGGTQGDNLVKTKLSTGTMDDVFWYNSGSLLQALNPSQTMVDLTGDPVMQNVDESFLPSVTQGGKVYGVPQGTAMGGGVLYNKDVYSKLGLQIPKTWADFEANNEKIKAAGITPVIETFKAPDTWTSQLFVLADYYNVQVANPAFAKDYTANKVKYATDPAAVKGFQKLAEVKAKGYVNSNYGSASLAQGLKLLGTGKGAQYPMLTFVVGTMPKDQQPKIGFFGIPGDDASKAGATIWEPGAAYISKTSKNQALAKKFLAFMASPAGTDAYSQGSAPTGPYLVKGSTLPADAPPVAADIQKYIDSKNVSPALEFLSPVKGPSLEQITVAVGTGQTSPQQGAAQYDDDVTKEAKQLGLPGW
jgi:raffinose/stachyose/melibiose transport system substrate-binding protein